MQLVYNSLLIVVNVKRHGQFIEVVRYRNILYYYYLHYYFRLETCFEPFLNEKKIRLEVQNS